jgi:hypothetical protein
VSNASPNFREYTYTAIEENMLYEQKSYAA